jgi:hypothetical protein
MFHAYPLDQKPIDRHELEDMIIRAIDVPLRPFIQQFVDYLQTPRHLTMTIHHESPECILQQLRCGTWWQRRHWKRESVRIIQQLMPDILTIVHAASQISIEEALLQRICDAIGLILIWKLCFTHITYQKIAYWGINITFDPVLPTGWH